MGAAGGVHFYQTIEHPDIETALRRFIAASGVERIQSVSRTPEKANRLRWILNGLLYREQRLGEKLLPADVDTFYRRWWVTHVWLHESPWCHRMCRANRDSPELDWGRCSLCDLGVTVGWHDMLEDAGRDEAVVVARAFLDVNLYCEGSPGSGSLGASLPGLPIVQEIKGVVEDCFGPVETCVLWNF